MSPTPLFKGPDEGGEMNQLVTIARIRPPPSDTDLRAYSLKQPRLQVHPEQHFLQHLGDLGVSSAGRELISALLAWNPRRRMTASQGLAHRFFTNEYPDVVNTPPMSLSR